ncbi:ATP-dependent DNA helicase PIF1-like protein [Tanacetum coccineum]
MTPSWTLSRQAEAPMTHKHYFKALDKSLRDILHKSKHDTMNTSFGNMTVQLTANMRVTVCCRPKDVNEIKDFVEWILKLGDGKLGKANNGELNIVICDEMFIKD